MKLLLSILFLFLVGCAYTPEEILVPVPYYIKVVCEDLSKIDPIKPIPVVFVSGTDTEGYEILGLRGSQYSNLSINSAETIRYIIEQTESIRYYKGCIADHNVVQDEKGSP